MKKNTFQRILRLIWKYFMFFSLISVTVTCCMSLFLNVFSSNMGITLGIRSTWDLWKNVPDNTFPTWPIHGFLLGHIAYLLLFSALFYMVISWVLKKKLNLS